MNQSSYGSKEMLFYYGSVDSRIHSQLNLTEAFRYE
jgi:hypothetical protein